MSNTHLHIRDALDGAFPGTLIASQETKALQGPLWALIGRHAATLVLKHAGRAGVLHMDAAELVTTTGVTKDAAERLVAARRLFHVARHREPPMPSPRHVLDALPPGLADLEVEVLLAIALDAGHTPIGTVLLAQGGPTSASVVPKHVFTPLVRLGARQFILVHNHPSGCVTPSEDDVRLTNTIAQLGFALGISLVDHLIVGGSDIASFFDLGLMPTRQELLRLDFQHVEVADGL